MLREQFIPQRAEHTAMQELINIRQQQGDTMENNFLRASLILTKAPSFHDGAAMRIFLERANRKELPMTVVLAKREVNEGRLKSVADLRAYMQKEAQTEPSKQ